MVWSETSNNFFFPSIFAAIIAPLVSALTVQAPVGANSGGQVTLMWISDPGDPSVDFAFL